MLIFSGALVTNMDLYDIVAAVLFCILGLTMKHLDWPRPPMLLGYILGPSIEKFYFSSQMIFGYTWMLRPGVIVILILTALCLYVGIRVQRKETEVSGSDGGRIMKLTFTEMQIPHLVVLVVTAVFLFLTMGWSYETYLFPRLICCVVLITVLISLYSEMREEKKSGWIKGTRGSRAQWPRGAPSSTKPRWSWSGCSFTSSRSGWSVTSTPRSPSSSSS